MEENDYPASSVIIKLVINEPPKLIEKHYKEIEALREENQEHDIELQKLAKTKNFLRLDYEHNKSTLEKTVCL